MTLFWPRLRQNQGSKSQPNEYYIAYLERGKDARSIIDGRNSKLAELDMTVLTMNLKTQMFMVHHKNYELLFEVFKLSDLIIYLTPTLKEFKKFSVAPIFT
jgi:hypothetical protein